MIPRPRSRTRSLLRSTGVSRGFTLVEMLIVVAIIIIMSAMSIPLVQSTLAYYDLQSAVSSVSGAISSTRYRAIADGYRYKVTISKSNHSYQVASCPGWVPTDPSSCTYANVDGPIPVGSASVTIAGDVAVEFFPSGVVSFSTGASPIVVSRPITDKKTATKSITVSNYGSITVQ